MATCLLTIEPHVQLIGVGVEDAGSDQRFLMTLIYSAKPAHQHSS